MKLKRMAGIVAVAVLIGGCDQATKDRESSSEAALSTQEQKLSYIFGQNIGSQFRSESVDVDVEAFSAGVRDALDDAEPRLSEEEMMTVLEAFQEQQIAKQEAETAAAAEENKAAGEAFLAENAEKEGVVALDSGLQYKVIEEGEGASPAADDTVKVHYRGTLIDGTVFDSSYKRGVPATFGVNQVIPGWTEALQLMKEGAKWELYIPPSLAYGPGGTGGAIGPNETLIFEVELLDASVEEGEDAAAASAETEKSAGGETQ